MFIDLGAEGIAIATVLINLAGTEGRAQADNSQVLAADSARPATTVAVVGDVGAV